MNNGKKVATNIIWRFLESCGAQSVNFMVSIILARLLEPELYGTLALITVFTTIISLFIDLGLGTALIQKKETDEIDFCSVFYFNIFSGLILYFILFLCAPLIANFYNNSNLTIFIRVQSLILIISSFKNIQYDYVAKNMIFKKFFFATLGGTITAAITGIWMAYNGFGIWALIVQCLLNNFIDTIILWITVKWRPKLLFSFTRIKELLKFGWKILTSALLATGYEKIRQLIIGKQYSPQDLSFYDKGNHFPEFITNNINPAINSVLLPAMSKQQDDLIRLKEMTRKSLMTSAYLIMPLMMGLAVCSEPFTLLLLTEKWLPCVFYMRIFCYTYALSPINTANINAIQSMGRSDIFLKLQIIKTIIGIIAVLATMFISVKAMALSLFVSSTLCQLVNSWPNKKLLNYSYFEQIKDLMPIVFITIVMGSIVYCFSFLNLKPIILLLIQIPTGVLIYVILSKIFKIQSFNYLLSIIVSYFQKKKE